MNETPATGSVLSEISATNAVIFVSDALRWDHLPRSVRELGVCFKTVAQSTATNTSVPSLLTGLYPPKHGVSAFNHQLSNDIESLFDNPQFEASYETLNTWWQGASPIYGMLDFDERGRNFDSVGEPFVSVFHDKGGHGPFDGKSFSEFDSRANIRRAYRDNVSESETRFHELLTDLEERGIRDDTLVVFTSDHGELLGEYGGLYGHGHPMCPELVYVPTVFVHPDLPDSAPPEDRVAEQVDILPTVYDVLDVPAPDTDGESLTETGGDEFGLSYQIDHHQIDWADRGYEARGYFEPDSGYVFHEAKYIRRLVHFVMYRLNGHDTGSTWRRLLSPSNVPKAKAILSNQLTFGDPTISAAESRQLLDKHAAGTVGGRSEIDLDDDTREAMQDLGYL